MLEMDGEYEGNVEDEKTLLLTGYWGGFYRRACRKQEAFPCLLYVGHVRTTTGTHVFGALKGALDGGLDIPHVEKRFAGFPKESKQLDPEVHCKYIYAGHVAAYMSTLMEDEPEKYQSHFRDVKNGIEPDDIEALYKKVHTAIRADPSAKTSEKAPPKAHKSYYLKKLTFEERKQRLIERLNILNSTAGEEDDNADK